MARTSSRKKKGFSYHPVKKKHQTGKTHKKQDLVFKAKHPGKRKSRRGTYYEYRKNRSDLNRTRKL